MAENSGPLWCARFPCTTSLDDLVPPFGDSCRAFISQLKKAGATVSIATTYRPPERAYLMHWCCMTANSGQDPHMVPPMKGVGIDWAHGGAINPAREAARKMMAKYQIAFPAALTSRHTQRRAIDMTIGWKGALKIMDFNGQSHAISTGPRNGSHPQLIAVGKTFGVIKLASDPPHWSDDGR